MQKAITEFIRNIEKSRGGNIRVGFVGLGTTNRPIIDTVSKNLPNIPLVLRQSSQSIPSSASELPKGIRLITGGAALCEINEDILFTSPSVRREKLIISEKTVVTSDSDIFFDMDIPHRFAVTGSDGKSTVTTLITLLLQRKFPNIFSGGNLGTPLALADLDTSFAFAVEMSSFSLRYTKPKSERAVITNITPNHLNWHESYEEYIEAKLAILENTREPIINVDTPECMRAAEGRELFAACSTKLTSRELSGKLRAQHSLTLEGGSIHVDGTPVIARCELKRNEIHNVANLMSALAATLGYINSDDIRRVARGFDGLAHRCESVGTYRGISFINSSIDTSPARTAATLTSLDRRVSIILGGRGKGLDLSPLEAPLCKYAVRIAIYGDMSDELLRFIESHRNLDIIPHRAFPSFDEAFAYLLDNKDGTDTVLLSPAATAYGEFSSFAERGEHFTALARNTL